VVGSTGAHGLSGLRATVLVSPVDNQYSSSLPFRKLDRRVFRVVCVTAVGAGVSFVWKGTISYTYSRSSALGGNVTQLGEVAA